ncbi:hypothetical protein EV424DRAFT_1343213 [Suillus variegatus]|nr:hypothetical protein EV424DRAFT_1343213 [Suillus variegatus]
MQRKWRKTFEHYNYVVAILGIRTSVNDLVKTYESSKIQESESAIASPQVMVIWRVVPFLVQQGRSSSSSFQRCSLSLLLISLLLHPNRHALAIWAHVPKTVHPWVAPLENPASEVASMSVLTIVLLLNLSVIMTAVVVIVGGGDAKGM